MISYSTRPLCLLLVGMWAGLQASAAGPDFHREILPLLQKHCWECHGPDSREGGVRLSSAKDLRISGDSGHLAVIPGDPDASALMQRVVSQDPEERMPKNAKALSDQDQKTLRSWIENGAIWAAADQDSVHWAYVAPVRPEVPSVQQGDQALDAFVQEILPEHGLKPSGPASPAALIRRVYLDLIGLPPAPEVVARFERQPTEEAYKAIVDDLLQSPRYGEHWAVQWLDLARYADSNGFQADQLRDSWAYRDWVIEAFNSGMPFDRFTVEQIAGDLLPDASESQRIATGFHRTVTCNVEAGVHPEENRVNQVIDRVNTTGTVWLGTTLECAQCHNHKYDPFSMEEYYRLFAYFNQTPLEVRNPSGKGVSFDFWGPTMDVALPKQDAERRRALLARQAAHKKERAELEKELLPGLEAWRKKLRAAEGPSISWKVPDGLACVTEPAETFEVQSDGSLLWSGPAPDQSIYRVQLPYDSGPVGAVRLTAMTDQRLPSTGPGRNPVEGRPNFVLQEVRARLVDAKGASRAVTLSRASADFTQSNFHPRQIHDGEIRKQNGWAIAGSFGQTHWIQFQIQPPLPQGSGEFLELELIQQYGGGRTIGRLLVEVAERLPEDEKSIPKKVLDLASRESLKGADLKELRQAFFERDERWSTLRNEEKKIEESLAAIQVPTTLVMVEQETNRVTHVMKRGNYLDPGMEVKPGTPSVLHALSEDGPPNRLGLAEWLVDRRNPLVARVTVNRWWAAFFGRGLVETLEDFGTRSEQPSHPKLLDWLAVEFMDSGWSMKHIHRCIVLSRTYRQSSHLSPDAQALDPRNVWLARAPRLRLSAETLRDQALFVSGMLSEEMTGPPVMPYQPPGLWRQVGRNEPKWEESPGERRYRRGVYVIWRRAAPYPSFVNFDAPDRSSCVVARPRTNTPLQALTLLNDPAYVEAAWALADRVVRFRAGAGDAEKLDYAWKLCLCRAPHDDERKAFEELLRAERERLRAQPAMVEATMKLAPPGHPLPSKQNALEVSVWFSVANGLLNLDEMITKG